MFSVWGALFMEYSDVAKTEYDSKIIHLLFQGATAITQLNFILKLTRI